MASKSRGDRRAHSITDPLPNGADRGCTSADRRVRRHPGDRICVQHRNRDRVRYRDGNCNRDCDRAGERDPPGAPDLDLLADRERDLPGDGRRAALEL